MKITVFKIVILLCCVTNLLTAQNQKTLYLTMDVNDSINQIKFDFTDSCQIIPWAHEGKIMIETIAAMETTNREILNTFITAGRYEIVSDNSTFVKTIRFAYKRPLIKNTQGIALKENVIVRIYVPENFNMKKMVAYKIDKQVLVAGK